MSRPAQNVIGRRFGRLEVMHIAEPIVEKDGRVRRCWVCKCDCGETKTVREQCLISGQTRSCGCIRDEHLIDLVGQRFGRLVVAERAGSRHWKPDWRCICDCGGTTIVTGYNLRAGVTTSCGCRQRSVLPDSCMKHGGTGTRMYRVWKNMRGRCLNANNPRYKDYGGRGITICDEWIRSFDAFREWALSNGYSESLTIDRINNDGNYEPGNCRFATYKQQAQNQRPRSRSHK
jgi:hypothetical protein